MTPSSPSTFASLLALALLGCAGRASAQACCAGSSAVTPARLGVHETALVGVQARGAFHLGSHDRDGRFVPTPSHAREVDLEQNLFAAVRVLSRGQLAALVPFIETHRASSGTAATGGGVGDINLSARFDPLLAGEARVPGIGFLAGVTLPTGRPAESARQTFATDATGVGALQANGGVAVEQTFGPWFVGLSALVALRAARHVRATEITLAPQYTAIASIGYAFDSGATGAASLSWSTEGDARADGVTVAGTARRVAVAAVAAAVPLTDAFRLIGSVFANPPVRGLGLNQPTTAGLMIGLIGAYT